MSNTLPDSEAGFSTTLPIQLLVRPLDQVGSDWQELDRGPGYFKIPAGCAAGIRIRTIDTQGLELLVKDIGSCPVIISLNLSENRNITDNGLEYLQAMRQLTDLNLSSCALTDHGIKHLLGLPQLTRLNLSYCNRITDIGIKLLRGLHRLTYLDLQGCVKISNGGVSKLRRQDLTIHWKV
jgi:hypothetical protein